ncbi:ComF family protein [Flexivirga sp. B27]
MAFAALRAVADLALPRTCAGCAAQPVALCEACSTELRDAMMTVATATRPTPCPEGFPVTWSQTSYDGVVAALLRSFKDAGRADLAPQLGRLLRSALAGLISHDPACAQALHAGQQLLVVPMPSRSSSTRGRGREPTVELTRSAVRATPPLVVCRALRVSDNGRDQAGLGAQDRARNLRGAMRLSGAGRARVRGRVCVVLDDIVTTGSSLVEARATLLSGGATDVVAATVAATRRRGG